MNVFSFLLLHCILLRVSTANILQNETDRQALLAFKSQITLDPLRVLSSWNYTNSFCQWEGVTCSRKHQRVTVLNLHAKGLMGTISPYLGNLSFLRVAALQNNSFHGEIPRELGSLFRLELLYLDSNSLVGEIPINISLCSNLKELMMNKNNLLGKVPMELGSLAKLVVMNLGENKLTGRIPSSLGNLTSIETLGLGGNSLSGSIPSTLNQLRNLRELLFGPNKLSGMFPPTLYNLSTLEVISIPLNHLTGILPTDIGFRLPNLKRFYIGNNRFSGPIPPSLFNASRLQKIDLSTNHFTGKVPINVGNLQDLLVIQLQVNALGSGKSGDLDFFTSLTNCTNLQDIVIYTNQFGGALPSSIGNFSNQLTSLYLSENQISGNIPTEIENLQNMILLDLGSNFLNGSIPTGFGKLQELQMLSVSYNQLSGELPSFVKNLSNLFVLMLSNNKFEGSISLALENQILQNLDISCNNFSGSIPKEIGLSSRLIQINFTHNFLSGSIPLEVGNLKHLEYMSLSWNNLSGNIPSTLGSCSSLGDLYLEGNSFEGTLPSSLTSLKSLVVFDVSHNNLSGNVSKEFARISTLTSLNLSFNNFEGEVPTEGIFRNGSAFSILGNQNICGGVSKLGLHKCRIRRSRKQGIPLAIKLTLGLLIPAFMVGLFLVIYLRNKPKTQPPSEQYPGDTMRVSYHDLHRATKGFSMENLVGIGSYGSVYKGTLYQNEDPVAVKVLDLMKHGASKVFLAECEALRAVRHRNLLKILTVCSSVDSNGEDFKALVFELMPKGSLESWLHPTSTGQHVPRHLNIYKRLNIAVDVASALDYLHNRCENPIAHCDLKPSNVLLDDDFTAHVGDFGLAKLLTKNTGTSNKTETSSIAVRGTIGYIPPEYGMGGGVSTQGDVYSFGILLLEIFTGKRPTDQMFNEGVNIHDFCKMAIPQRVMEIIDMRLLSEETHDEEAYSITLMKEALTSVLKIGVACSVDLISQRMSIEDVLNELSTIKMELSSGLNS